jgi:deoxyribodipyrimidine photo-lyase
MQSVDQPVSVDAFAPTLAAARARLAAVRPTAYARTRNALDGAVTRLSPYLTHGLLSLPEVLRAVHAAQPLPVGHKFVFELGWRAYFRHVWADRGAGILQSLHDGPLPDAAYARELPADVREARTGVPAIDRAVRSLYVGGYLHNHARMWLASYLVHLRKVHWRTGADWLYGHLLDGDLASNHLSWQWVAGTGSHKPYLFNADNVQRHAPPEWHSAGTVLDAGYGELDRIARDPRPVPGGAAGVAGVEPQPVLAAPSAALGAVAPDADAVRGREVWLVHPWSLGDLPADLPSGAMVLGVLVDDFHRAWPWSPQRWAFVGARLRALAPRVWHGDAAAIGSALAAARRVQTVADPHLDPWLARWAEARPAAALFPPVRRRCDSFSQWWTRATKGLTTAEELLS